MSNQVPPHNRYGTPHVVTVAAELKLPVTKELFTMAPACTAGAVCGESDCPVCGAWRRKS
jgi:hypothetical protein